MDSWGWVIPTHVYSPLWLILQLPIQIPVRVFPNCFQRSHVAAITPSWWKRYPLLNPATSCLTRTHHSKDGVCGHLEVPCYLNLTFAKQPNSGTVQIIRMDNSVLNQQREQHLNMCCNLKRSLFSRTGIPRFLILKWVMSTHELWM